MRLVYTGENKDILNLPQHYKAAIEKEAKIQILGYQLSKTYGNTYKKPEVVEKKFNSLCEQYGSNPEKVKQLAIKDSKYLFLFPLTKDREQFYIQEATEIALGLDNIQSYLNLKKNKSR